MKIVLAGGTGQVGQVLRREFADAEVVVIARSEGCAGTGGPSVTGSALEGADALINLAGRTIDCRYTPANRPAIMRSRLESTWGRWSRRWSAARCRRAPPAVLDGDDLR